MSATDLRTDPIRAEVDADDGASSHHRPAAVARVVDLPGLRHDFPLVLTDAGAVVTLSGVVDDLLTAIAPTGARGERLRQHVLRLETAIRRRVADTAAPGTLTEVWAQATDELLADDDEALRTSLETARAALHVDGRLVRCDRAAPAAVVGHLRAAVEGPRAAALHDQLAELARRLTALLAVDEHGTAAGREPDRLRGAVGAPHEEDFDFAAWSEVLATRPRDEPLPEARRSRIEWARTVLRDQRFVPLDHGATEVAGWTFDSCALALQAHQERLPELARVVKAVAIAELELDNAYDEAAHGAWFQAFGAAELRREDLQPFPRPLVLLHGDALDAATRGQVLDLLGSTLPWKVVVITDDAVGAAPLRDVHGPRPLHGVGLAAAARGLGTAHVVQTTAAGLARMADALRTALASDGPALLSIVTAAAQAHAELPPYLAAAAAAETRLVPEFSDDPQHGCLLAATSQPSVDWPVHPLLFEDEHLQRVREDLEVTPADLVATDPRFAGHGATWPRHAWTDDMLPVAELLRLPPEDRRGRVPYVAVVDRDDLLQRVVVDDDVVALAERTLHAWRHLQERAGARLGEEAQRLADERAALEAARAALDAAGPVADEADVPAAATPASEDAAQPQEPADEPAPTEAWIETARCTTCDECTTLNPRMFAYNEEKQAYIADLHAGTYGELVQAAEACQVAIIHPGEPWDETEAGVEELRRRAAAFT